MKILRMMAEKSGTIVHLDYQAEGGATIEKAIGDAEQRIDAANARAIGISERTRLPAVDEPWEREIGR